MIQAETPATSGIEFENVSKWFDAPQGGEQTAALHEVTLSIEPGKLTCVLGPSGCGKTTLLNLAAGFDEPTFGRISVAGHGVSGVGPDRAVVFQQPALFPWMDVWKNVTVTARAQGTLTQEFESLAREMIQRVGLGGSERHYPYQLSGGMKQRVQIARALLSKPDVILMDEPFGALDAQTRLRLQELMLEIVRIETPTVMFVTHDIEEAVLLADRVVVLAARPGRLLEEIEIDLGDERSYESMALPAFIEAKQHLLSLIHESAHA
jgi:NitT/TauT family transport system ATP-binding protein